MSNDFIPDPRILVAGNESCAPEDRVESLYADDPDFSELLDYFREALHERKSQVVRALRTKDCQTLASLSHQLKGAGTGYGYPELTAIAGELERICKTGKGERIPEATQNLLDYMDRIH